jgi:uncharacterized protein YkwD
MSYRTTSHTAKKSPTTGWLGHPGLGGAVIAVLTAIAIVLPFQTSAQATVSTAPTSAPAAAGSGATSGQQTARPHKAPLTQAKYERRLHHWANRARAHHGVPAVKVRPCHENFAEHWARHLATKDEFYHQDLGNYMGSCHLGKAGEILALGSVSPFRMIRMWLNSSEHRDILLDPSYKLAGMGARKDSHGSWIGCIDFGRRL